MKNFISLSLALFFIQNIEAYKNSVLRDYFVMTYENEKKMFQECIGNEGLKNEKKIYTKCEINKNFSKAYYSLYDKKLKITDLIKDFEAPVRSYTPKVRYPEVAQQRGMEGYVIVSFDISIEGITTNHNIKESVCGRFTYVFSDLNNCNIFNASALNAARQLSYMPAKYDNQNIDMLDSAHRFTYKMSKDGKAPLDVKKNKLQVFIEADRNIKLSKYEEGKTLATKNLKYDEIFYVLIAQAELNLKNFEGARENILNYIDYAKSKNPNVPFEIGITSAIIYLESLYQLSLYDEIADFEESFFEYLDTNDGIYNDLFNNSYLYFALVFANKGDIFNTAYYLNQAYKYSNSDHQREFIDNYVQRISSYLQ